MALRDFALTAGVKLTNREFRLRDARPEGVPEEVELRVRVLLLATSVLAIDNLRLCWVDREAARRESLGERRQNGLRLRFRFEVCQPDGARGR